MKKTTKILLVLAAVVAMTIGAMSTVMAADEYRTVDPATWELQDNDTWQAKDTDGKQLENCWAKDANGKWYYFEGKAALQEEFLKWRGDYYYFDDNCYMCTSWVEFDDDDEDIIEDYLATALPYFAEDTAYEKSIWCFFGTDGVAAMDEWVNNYGLWYYFDGMVMVCDDYDYTIVEDGKEVIYGFGGDGNMLIDWHAVAQKNDNGKEGPVKGTDTLGSSWVYYNKEGDMVEAGWNKIDGVWYYFVANEVDKFENPRFATVIEEGTPVMIHSAYLEIEGNNFYFNGDGVMQTGEVKFAKKQKFYTSVDAFLSTKLAESSNKEAYVFFDTKTGAQKYKDKANSAQWFLNGDETVYYASKGTATAADATTGSAIDVIDYTAAAKVTSVKDEVEGEKIFNAFRVTFNDDGECSAVYYYDGNGNMVKKDVVDIKVDDVILTLAFDKDGKLQGKSTEIGDKVKLNGTYYYYSDVDFGQIVIGGETFMACGTKKPDIED